MHVETLDLVVHEAAAVQRAAYANLRATLVDRHHARRLLDGTLPSDVATALRGPRDAAHRRRAPARHGAAPAIERGARLHAEEPSRFVDRLAADWAAG